MLFCKYCLVEGRVTRVDGSVPPNVEVVVVDVDLRSEQVLGSAQIANKDGSYQVKYTPEQFRRAEKRSADLKVNAFPAGDNRTSPLAVSEIRFNVADEITIDLVVGGSVVRGPSEFKRILNNIKPLLEGLELGIADLVEDDDHQDITFLVGELGEDEDKIRLLIAAHGCEKQAKIPADIFYGLFREKVPANLTAVAGSKLESLQSNLQLAMDENIIDAKDTKSLQRVLDQLKGLGVRLATQLPDSESKTPFGLLVSAASSSPLEFVKEVSRFDGDPAKFWRNVATNPATKGDVEKLQFAVQMGAATLSHMPLINKLTEMRNNGSFMEFSDLTKFRQSDWRDMIQKWSVGVPAAIIGDDEEARIGNYTKAISNLIEDTFPSKFFAQRLADLDDDKLYGHLARKTDIRRFLEQTPQFNISSTPITDFAARFPDSMTNFENTKDLSLQIAHVQRVFAVAPRYTQTRTLIAGGVISSMQIARMGSTMFMNSFASKLGNVADAIAIYEKARQNHAMAINLWSSLSPKFNPGLLPPFLPPWLRSPPVQKAIPDWKTLFGSSDSCSCDQCSSILGPAAYFVDILHFLKDRIIIDQAKTTRKDGKITAVVWRTVKNGNDLEVPLSAKDVLFSRRLDLGNIHLTCENTNIPVVYIDLTLEILENHISPFESFKPFTLPTTAIPSLDLQKIAEMRTLLQPKLPPSTPISDSAVINVLKAGESWTIDEPGYTYFIHKDDNVLRVSSRGLQTRGSSAERAACSQYVNSAAYDALKTEVYPANLPFDLWMETVRSFLAHLDVRRHQIMEVMSSVDGEQTISSAKVVQEHLGLTNAETRILLGVQGETETRFTDVWRLFGFQKADLDSDSSIPDPLDKFKVIKIGTWQEVLTSRIDVFIQQAQISYRELLNCAQVWQLFDAELRLEVTSIDPQNVDECDLSKLRVVGVSKGSLSNLIRCTRLQKKLEGWTMLDIMRAFDSKPMPAKADQLRSILLGISCTQRLSKDLGIAVEDVLTFWQNLSTARYRDYLEDGEDKETPRSQYERIFRNETIGTPQDQRLPKDASLLSGSLNEHLPVFTASLNISSQDLSHLLGDSRIVPNDTLNLEHLSMLFRHVILVRALDLSPKAYLAVLRLLSIDPFESPVKTVLAVDRIKRLVDSPFGLSQVEYLLRHRIPKDEDVNMPEEVVLVLLDDLRKSLQQTATEFSFSEELEDPKGDLTRKKLALLNWDLSVVAQAVGVISNSISYQMKLKSPLPDEIVLPEKLNDVLTYDEATPGLSFSRIMLAEERDLLLGLDHATDDFKAAIEHLFASPERFLKRNMRFFSVQSSSVTLASIPPGVKIPQALSSKVYWDKKSSTINTNGVLTDAEREVLKEGVSDQAYLDVIDALYDEPLTRAPGPDDGFLDDTDIAFLLDAANKSNPSKRFMAVLKKLLPHLLETLSDQTVKQKLSQLVGLTTQLLDPLLSRYLKTAGMPLKSAFRDAAFAASNVSIPVTVDRFQSQYHAVRLLEKISMIAKGFKLGTTELNWLFGFREVDTADVSNGWLNLGQLPLRAEGASIPNISGWERLLAVFKLRDSLSYAKDILDEVWKESRRSTARVEDVLTTIARLTSWSFADLQALAGPSGFSFVDRKAFQDEVGLAKIMKAIGIVRKVGCTVSDALLLQAPDVTEKEARVVRQAVKSKYDQQTWNTVARPLQNILRETQRAALVSYILCHPNRSQPRTWRTPADMSAFFLVDVEQGPCAVSSRIKQAIGSVQTFVQRCLLNLEAEVEANTEVDNSWGEWTRYLKSILLTTANREIWCYPENVMESAFRDDKTPYFKEFESQLLQNPVTKESAEQAIMRYIESLDVVGHLHVLSYYHQKEQIEGSSNAVDILHVFARTQSVPWRYFYAKRLDAKKWTPWEKLNVDVQGEHLIPIVWNRRLHLFWGIFTDKQESQAIKMPAPNEELPPAPTYVDVQLGWSELRTGAWTSKQITEQAIRLPKTPQGPPEISDDFKNWYSFRASINSYINALTIRCWHKTYRPARQGRFIFQDVRGAVRVKTNPRLGGNISLPKGTRERSMTYMSLSNKEVWLPELTNKVNRSDVTVLRNSPATDFTLVFPSDRIYPYTDSPFFYQHDEKTFLVEPDSVFAMKDPRFSLVNKATLHPGLLEGGLIGRYLATPMIALIKDDFPGPLEAGAVHFLPSGPIITNPPPELEDFDDRLTSFGISIGARSQPALLTGLTVSNFKIPDLSAFQIPLPDIKISNRYKFSSLYHPYTTEFMRHLNRDGLDGLYQRPLQLLSQSRFNDIYQPDPGIVDMTDLPVEDVDFLGLNMHSVANYELFLFIPMMIGDHLSQNFQFREAQKWHHRVFNPTDTSSLPSPARFWQMGHFFKTSKKDYNDEMLPNIMLYLARGASGVSLSADETRILQNLEESIRLWRKNPFNPFLVARSRTTAFQKWVVMKYLDNIIAWGDYLFRQDTIEAINEATQLYILASEILGDRPVEIPRRAVRMVQTFNSIADSLDDISNSLVQVEGMVSAANNNEVTVPVGHEDQVGSPSMLYFCIPNNPKFLSYWDTVEDRLNKIRSCQNLLGITRELALFEPPLDLKVLVRAAAAGVDVNSAMSESDVSLSQYRYPTLFAKAIELVTVAKEFGRSFLEALEKRDAAELALMQSQNEGSLLEKVKEVKQKAIDEALSAMKALDKGKSVVQTKRDHFKDRDLMNAWESAHMLLELGATVLDLVDSGAQPVSATLYLVPDAKLGAPTSIGIMIGGPGMGKSASKFGKFMAKLGGLVKHASQMTGEMGSYHQRKDGWDLEAEVAEKELRQIDEQITGATRRAEMAQKDLNSHEKQIENTAKMTELMRTKFSNTELYEWTIAQLSSMYFQGYQMAYDAAKRAQRAFIQETGNYKASFIRFGAWDSLKKGLLAGEQLHQDLLRLDSAYMEQLRREYEITQHISLSQIDPVALLQLQTTGECYFRFSEAVFDLSHPGHYMRRLKSVGITVPCIVGPYTSVSATLSLLKSSTRTSPLTPKRYARGTNDIRFHDSFERFDSICTSTGINDHGMFEFNLHDERYLPFEYEGAESSWRLVLPSQFRQFDYQTISDVVFHVRYTAREGGDTLRETVETELRSRVIQTIQMAEGQSGLARLIQLRRDFPDDFYRLTRPTTETGKQEMTMQLTRSHLPYMLVAAKNIKIGRAMVLVRLSDEALSSSQGSHEDAGDGTPAPSQGSLEEGSEGEPFSKDNLRVSIQARGAGTGSEAALVDWNGLRRVVVDVNRPWGDLVLTVSQVGGAKVPSDAIEDILLVLYYSAEI